MQTEAEERYPIQELRDGVIDIILKNFDYFKSNPKHMAWAMMNYELIHRVGRRFGTVQYDCEDNPKHPIQDAGEDMSEEDSDLLYDAWAITVSNYDEFPDTGPNLELQSKANMTVDDWIELWTDPNYQYNDIFPNAWRVKDHLLCVNGSGLSWNEDGFIARTGPSGVDENVFAGYTRAEEEVREDIREQILALTKDPLVTEGVGIYIYGKGSNQCRR